MGLVEAAEIDGVENVAVDYQAASLQVAIEDVLEECGGGFGKAVIGAQVKVGDDQCVEAGGVGGVWGMLPAG